MHTVKIRHAEALKQYEALAAKIDASVESNAEYLSGIERQALYLQLLEVRAAKTLAILHFL